jgi:hypothetical protein
MDNSPIGQIRRTQKQSFCGQQVYGLRNLRFSKPAEFCDVSGGIIVGIIGKEEKNIDFPHGKAGSFQNRAELIGIEFFKLLGKLKQSS